MITILTIIIMIMIRCAECVAIGECGLDFNRNFSPPEVQIEVFEKQVIMIENTAKRTYFQPLPNCDDPQVLLACELGKPLFLHERDAHPEMVSILERLVAVLMMVFMKVISNQNPENIFLTMISGLWIASPHLS